MPTESNLKMREGYFKYFGKHVKETPELRKIYSVWLGLRARCDAINNKRYCYYGQRGITYSKHWESFINFFEDMGFCPEGHSLDRIDNNGNYCKENCRWATPKVQVNNRRSTVHLECAGKMYTQSEFCETHKLNKEKVKTQIRRGWTAEEILFGVRRGNIEFGGVVYSRDTFAKIANISNCKLSKRIQLGWSAEEIIKGCKCRGVEYKNILYTRLEFAKEIGISLPALNNRIKKGWGFEDAIFHRNK
jgi:hypothetical protein